ncbi:MAG: hypothetical protein EOM12_12355 [Verrucomicrobiae bacterium]|nr:hypothetical protein [Verrucomicrobiae bacterium]
MVERAGEKLSPEGVVGMFFVPGSVRRSLCMQFSGCHESIASMKDAVTPTPVSFSNIVACLREA